MVVRLLPLVVLALVSTMSFAQTTASLANGYFQDFDSLGLDTISSSAVASSGGNLGAINPGLAGAFLTRTGSAAGTSLAITADRGTSATGGYYNYSNTATNTDRALGGLYASDFGSPVVGFRLRNDTGSLISAGVGYSFLLEAYRDGMSSVSFSVTLVDSNLSDADFVANLATGKGFYFPPTRFNLPSYSGSGMALNGNAAENRLTVGGGNVFNPGIALGQDLAFRFVGDAPTTGTSSGFGVDNFRLNAVNPVPEPATMAAMALGLGALAARRKRKSA